MIGVHDDDRRQPRAAQHVDQARRSRARESRSAAACEPAAGAGAGSPPARSTSSASVASTSVSGSPPLRITSCSDVVGRDLVERRLPIVERARRFVVRKMPAEAVAAMDGARAGRDQQHAAVDTFAAAPAAASAASSPTGSATNPGTSAISSASGSTCRSSGSAGSPGRIRATNPRGTNSGNCRAAARAAAANSVRQVQQPAQFVRIAHRVLHRLLPRGVSRHGNLGRTAGGGVDRMVIRFFEAACGCQRCYGIAG